MNPTADAMVIEKNSEQTFNEFIKLNKLEDKPIIAILAGSGNKN